MKTHKQYMKRAITLAKKGWGKTNPNPLVGAVIVKNGKVIAEGFHEVFGGPHAEINAIKQAKHRVHDSTMYVNLEPCAHHGKTPPCVYEIINHKIKKVIIGTIDPNPKVSGKGVEILKKAGIEVIVGILEKDAKQLNEIFTKYITSTRPFVIMKSAVTLDGKIATYKGDSKWITDIKARNYAHKMRHRAAAIMVGINTVIADDPSLTARLKSKVSKRPISIIVDSKGRLPENSKIFSTIPYENIILATTSLIEKSKEITLSCKGIKIIKADGPNNQVDLKTLMSKLHKLGIDSILIEGGGALNASALESNIVDKVMFFIAPKIVGGRDAVTSVEGPGIKYINDCIKLKNLTIKKLGVDFLLEGYIN